ncbi:MAG: hypothetical protein H6586_01530 [Flavobacteriales bacterium]|nr:hypothetical protein [Flavobacteriales bacterium]
MKNLLAILIVLVAAQTGFGQTDNDGCPSIIDTLTHNKVFTFVDKMPEVDGGMEVLFKELFTNIKSQNKDCYSSKFIVAFIVNPDGKLTGKRIVRDQCGDVIANQILEIIDNVKWISGSCDDKNVSVLFTLPVTIDFR